MKLRAILIAAGATILVACDPASQAPPGLPSGPVARALNNLQTHPDAVTADGDHSFVARDVIVDPNGREHVRFDRFYKGLRVIGGDFVVHGWNDGRFDGASLASSARVKLDVRPGITEAQASRFAAIEFGGIQSGISAPELVVFADESAVNIAYEVVISGALADGSPSELHVLVDARSGATLETWEGIETSTGHGFFDGDVTLTTAGNPSSGFQLKDPTRLNQFTADMNNGTNGNGTLFVDSDDVWGDGTLANRQTVAVDAQYGTQQTYDYYLAVHGRNGIAGDGATGAFNRVHYSNNYSNAFWSDSCFCMTYGDGNGTTFYPFTALDVAGHEMSHGVTSRTARLNYRGEPGGLNEATSDIFGTMVEFYTNSAADSPDYLIGEKLYVANGNAASTPNDGAALRYMFYPEHDGASKGCYIKNLKRYDVHYSSGVANHFFYLLAEGTTPITHVCGTGLTFAGVGRSHAEQIWYRALTVYMTSSTNYSGAKQATLQAAADLYGAGGSDAQAVANAWAAVKVL